MIELDRLSSWYSADRTDWTSMCYFNVEQSDYTVLVMKY